MQACLFGAETEYALAALLPDGTGVDHHEVHDAFMAAAFETLPHLPNRWDPRPDLFLSNGGRLYFDCGYRIELATPEVTTPAELVRYLRAGDVIVGRVARRLAATRPDWAEVFCSRVGVDYLHQTAWASHESVLLREGDPTVLGRALLPFLVSRIVFSGAGGFDAFGRGIRFLLSPRAAFITQIASSNTMQDRPILSTRDEALAKPPYRRLHIPCGETLCSDLGLYLRAGTTALVARVLERAPGTADGLALEHPVRALRTIAADPTCRRRVPLRDGRRMTAIEIQRAHLEIVEAGIGAGWLPDWAKDVCRRWRAVLDGLERDPWTLGTSLDWVMKWTVYGRYLQQQGFNRRQLIAIDRALSGRGAGARAYGAPLRRGFRWWPAAPLPPPSLACLPALSVSLPALEQAGLTREDVDRAVACRTRLFEMDMRWGELGARGVFDALDAGGCLAHRVEECDRLDEAVERPPGVGRARLRGEAVRRLWLERRRATCTWDSVVDHDGRRTLDLTDPFVEDERWV